MGVGLKSKAMFMREVHNAGGLTSVSYQPSLDIDLATNLRIAGLAGIELREGESACSVADSLALGEDFE